MVPYVIKYMNDALNLYQEEEKVMHISGYMFPLNQEMPSTFFLKTTSCWGWATWKRAWKFFEKNVDKQISEIDKINGWKEFTFDFYNPSFKNQLELNQNNKINTWAIFWYASVFLNNGTSLHPYPSLVQNIGFDGTGVHCDNSLPNLNPYYWKELASTIKVKRLNNFKSKNEFDKTKFFFSKIYKTQHITIRDKFYKFRIKNKKRIMTLRDSFYLFRKGAYKLYFKKIYYILTKPSKVLIKESIIRENNNEDIVRFVSGEAEILGRRVFYVDKPSFDFIKNEMFNLQIYKFKSDKSNPLIIDCGANIGLSIIYFKTLFSNAKIIAFEPDPQVYNVLNKNIESFDLEDIELHNKALWTHEGEINFYSEGADAGRIEENIDSSKKNISLKCTKLSRFINEEVDFLKIDIEGAEFNVLNECQEKLILVKNLFIEYHSMTNQRQNLADLLSILTNNGFRYYISSIGIRSNHPFIFKNENLGMDNQLNIFATKD